MAAFERRCVRVGRAHLRAAQGAVASAAWQRLWLELGRLLAEGAWIEEHAALALPVDGFAASLLQQRAATLKKRGKRLQELDAAGRHRLRIAAKKLRYPAEFFAALFPKRRVRPYIQSLAAMQEVLGGLNDAATSLRLLPETSAGARTPLAVAACIPGRWSPRSSSFANSSSLQKKQRLAG